MLNAFYYSVERKLQKKESRLIFWQTILKSTTMNYLKTCKRLLHISKGYFKLKIKYSYSRCHIVNNMTVTLTYFFPLSKEKKELYITLL